MKQSHDAIQLAANHVIETFGRFDRDEYFACFDPEAIVTFYYQTTPLTVPEYQGLWREWESSGFRVLRCVSSNPVIMRIAEDVALFIHDVHTDVVDQSIPKTLHERESIVFRRRHDRWLVVHEHLSRPENPS